MLHSRNHFIIGFLSAALGGILLSYFYKPTTSPTLVSSQPQYHVGASFLPLYLAAREIAPPDITVDLLTPPGVSPADFTPDESFYQGLSRYALLFISGTDIDQWLDPHYFDTLPTVPPLINVSAHIQEGVTLPYFWLSPPMMIAASEKIQQEFARLVPAEEAIINQNALLFREYLIMLDRDLRARISGYTSRALIASYPYLETFAHTYGFEAPFTLTDDPSGAPSAALLATHAAYFAKNVDAALFAPRNPPAWILSFTQSNGIPLYVFDPLLYSTSTDALPFFEMMRANVDQINLGMRYMPPS